MSQSSSGILILTVCLSIAAQSHRPILYPHLNDTWNYEIMLISNVYCYPYGEYKVVNMSKTIQIIDTTQYACCHKFVASFRDSGFIAILPTSPSFYVTNGKMDIPDSLKHDTMAVYIDTCNDTNGVIFSSIGYPAVVWQTPYYYSTTVDSYEIAHTVEKGEYYGFTTYGSFAELLKLSKKQLTPSFDFLYIYSFTLGLIHFAGSTGYQCSDVSVNITLVSTNNTLVDLGKIGALFTDSMSVAFNSRGKAAIQSSIKAPRLVWTPLSHQIQCIRSDNKRFLMNGKKLEAVRPFVFIR